MERERGVCTLVISLGLLNKFQLRYICKTLVVQMYRISSSCHTFTERSLETQGFNYKGKEQY